MAATGYDTVVIKGDNITLSLLVWRRFKRPMPGLVGRILARQGNLASKVYLDVGDVVEIPIDAPTPNQAKIPIRKLWD
jgi:hypothetical protein